MGMTHSEPAPGQKPEPRKNIEIKYQLPDVRTFKAKLRRLAGVSYAYIHHQQDIFFDVPEGRLKLRIEEEKPPCLIHYFRTDQARPRPSQFTLTPVDSPRRTLAELQHRYGVLGKVEKWRELYWFRNVRIHIDNVRGLGWFVEFESVVSPEVSERQARKNLDELLADLSPLLGEPQTHSYFDLLHRAP
ncbi:MAG: CYTH domain-containing protein [Calditrichaeota bacterium]|nr:MAG: CYTH domain-containing protein [Calditrichota bacterium]